MKKTWHQEKKKMKKLFLILALGMLLPTPAINATNQNHIILGITKEIPKDFFTPGHYPLVVGSPELFIFQQMKKFEKKDLAVIAAVLLALGCLEFLITK